MSEFHSPEAEQSVIGCAMMDPQSVEGLSLDRQHFFDHRHQSIWAVVSRLVVAGKPADPVSLLAEIAPEVLTEVGGLAYLNALFQCVPSARGAARYAEIIREKAAQRAVREAADDALTIAAGDTGASEKIYAIVSAFSKLQREGIKRQPQSIADLAVKRTEHYDDLASGRVSAGWPTKIPALDRMLTGGLRPGMVYVVAARPSVGKSSLSQLLCMRMASNGLPSLFLSQEMGAEEVADRAVSNAGRIDYEAIQSGRMSGDDWTRAVTAMEALRELPFFVDDQGSLTLADIKAKARSIKGLKVLAIDYVQLCASVRKDGNRNAEVEEISRGVKALAMELGIAVILLSQLNRDVEKRASKRPTMSDLRDSGAIEQDADVIVFLWPVRDLNEGHRIVGCAVEKNRRGKRGAFGLDFFGATQEWHESTADINPPKQGGAFE